MNLMTNVIVERKGQVFQTGATAEPYLASDEGRGTRSVNSEKTS
jgi:hypothetical protein